VNEEPTSPINLDLEKNETVGQSVTAPVIEILAEVPEIPLPETKVEKNTQLSTQPENGKGFRKKVWHAIINLSIFEKIIFGLAVSTVIISGYWLLEGTYNRFSSEIPTSGGTLIEAATDYSRFINPILARSETDRDIAALVYSGLLKPDKDRLENDLARSVTKSDNGMTYTVVLKDNLKFHDNHPLTADDVIFTIQRIKDPLIKSPLIGNWTGISVNKIDDKTIEFNLPQAYEPFEQNLTVGILPAHLWASSSADSFDINPLNRKPIGSGPYKIESTRELEPGVISQYKLAAFDGYALKKPYITNYVFDMYKDEDSAIQAAISGKADIISGISIDKLRSNEKKLLKGRVLYTPLLPRTYSLFFNQSNSPVLLNAEVRTALNQAIDKEDLIEQVRGGYGTVAESPLPGESIHSDSIASSSTTSTLTTAANSGTTTIVAISTSTTTAEIDSNVAIAQKTLMAKGWKKGDDGIFQKQITLNKKTTTERLSLKISTSNSPELRAIAQYVANAWKNIGAEVSVEIYESSDLSEKIVIPRKYDVLLFGQVVGRDWDLYPFWHSSQQKDLGLNLAMYANKKVDTALETLRSTSIDTVRATAVNSILKEINKDIPAVFLYSPQYLLVMPNSVQGVDMSSIENSSERFYQVNKWYMKSRRVLNALSS
jgi:peptide/nickel transport system substrate-binding protein